MGKAAMAAILIERERDSHLATARVEDDHWYGHIWRQMTSEGRSSFGGNQLSVVTFNYDRSLEWSLINTYWHTFGGTLQKARTAVESVVHIVHVHGQLGDLAVESEEPGRTYRPELSDTNVAEAARGIVILPQADGESEAFRVARYYMENATQVVFLGFDYHPENLARLGIREGRQPQPGTKPPRMLGSCYGLTAREAGRRMTRLGIVPGDPGHRNLKFLRESVNFD